MLKSRRRLPAAAFVILTLAAAAPLHAQEGNVVGPPQLRDFQLPGERRTPARPPQVQPQPAQPAQTPPAAQPAPSTTPAQRQPGSGTQRERPQAVQPRAATPGAAPSALPSQPQDVLQLPQAPSGPPLSGQPEPQPSAAPAPDPGEPGTPVWYYAVGGGLLLLAATLLLRRRRRPAEAEAEAETEPLPEAAAVSAEPRPAPVPRPWLELEVKAERAASTDSEAKVEFELILRNTGKSPARNIRVNARMFNAGREQDKEIGAFFRTKGEGRKTHTIGDLPADQEGMIPGSVTMPREEVRALQVNDQLLFIPVLAVNVVYDWGTGRTGQTSKSYVIGRQLGEENEKMGAFRLDLGPRIYRTVGQRQHSLAKRV